jgi:hypothetical protein
MKPLVKEEEWAKISKLKGIDSSIDNITIEERIQKVEEWATEIKKTLRGGGIYKNEQKINKLLRQRFRIRKRDNVQDVSKLMMMTDTLPFGFLNSAKSFVDSSNVVEFSSKNPGNAADIKMVQKKIKILLEVSLIQQLDKYAVLQKRVTVPNIERDIVSDEIG